MSTCSNAYRPILTDNPADVQRSAVCVNPAGDVFQVNLRGGSLRPGIDFGTELVEALARALPHDDGIRTATSEWYAQLAHRLAANP